MKRRANAIWKGTGLEGSGSLTTQSKTLNNQPYSTKLRFENEDGKAGTNPEELLAAAHAGCFNMALSFQLNGAGFTATELNTDAVVIMKQTGHDWSVEKIELHLTAEIPDITESKFSELADNAKKGCPISGVLNCEIELKSELK